MLIKLSLDFLLILLVSNVCCWRNVPRIPSGLGRRLVLLNTNLEDKYGYDTSTKNTAKSQGSYYFFIKEDAPNFGPQHNSGWQGVLPKTSTQLDSTVLPPPQQSNAYLPPLPHLKNSADASYNFNIDTDSYKRQESSDPRGNIKGSYSYINNEGVHDLSYTAGENTGFVATSGSLSQPSGLQNSKSTTNYASYNYDQPTWTSLHPKLDGSYAYSYKTGDSSHQQKADSRNNVQGAYSYQNEAGNHDLSYVAGADTGFLVTGGSLSSPSFIRTAVPSGVTVTYPNGGYSYSTDDLSVYQLDNVQKGYNYKHPIGIDSKIDLLSTSAPQTQGTGLFSSTLNQDGSYKYGYSSDNLFFQQAADKYNNVQGSYAYKDQTGTNHDLSYIAGSRTGFLPTGGTLTKFIPSQQPSRSSTPNLNLYHHVNPYAYSTDHSYYQHLNANQDGSYSFAYDTGKSAQQQSADANNNVVGSYSYTDHAGYHDLSYTANDKTGFVVTGGNLAAPNKVPLTKKYDFSKDNDDDDDYEDDDDDYEDETVFTTTSTLDQDDGSEESGDASYSFSIDTNEYQRRETSDADGNIKGSYKYTNSAGNHDLTYIAGAETGFQGIGGSLSQPPGVKKAALDGGSYLKKSSQILGDHPKPRIYLPPTQKINYVLGTKE